MCNICGQPSWVNCNCQQRHNCGCPPPCTTTGCVVKLDTTCIIYHKNNNTLSGLTALGLSNGATLELILDTIDDYIDQIKTGDWNFPFLVDDQGYEINTLQQFATAVDETLSLINRFKGNVTADPSGAVDGDYWFRTDLLAANGLRIKVNGNVRTIPTT